MKWVIGVGAALLLSPVVGMVLVFAVLPALPIVLALGAVLAPTNLFIEAAGEGEEGVAVPSLQLATT